MSPVFTVVMDVQNALIQINVLNSYLDLILSQIAKYAKAFSLPQ